jgi:restriction system protein
MARPEVSKSRAIANKTLHLALTILKENGSQMRGQDVMNEMERRATFDEYERFIYPKTGYTRWRSVFHFYSIGLIKAGLLIKKKGVWYLTPEGEKSLSRSPSDLVDVMDAAYKDWRAANPISEQEEVTDESAEELQERSDLTLDEMQSRAKEGITAHIDSLNAYEFQNLCAALLRGMGYYTPFVSPKGRDGGIDIIAYRDPLGTETPRIKVQVKHRNAASANAEVNQLRGLLSGDGEVGIFISSGGFSPDARNASRSSAKHIELIDMDRFIELWEDFYHKLTDEDKRLLPLEPVYFLSPDE